VSLLFLEVNKIYTLDPLIANGFEMLDRETVLKDILPLVISQIFPSGDEYMEPRSQIQMSKVIFSSVHRNTSTFLLF
jgi:hypothetical protein